MFELLLFVANELPMYYNPLYIMCFDIIGISDNTVIVDSNLFEDVRFLQTCLFSLIDSF